MSTWLDEILGRNYNENAFDNIDNDILYFTKKNIKHLQSWLSYIQMCANYMNISIYILTSLKTTLHGL